MDTLVTALGFFGILPVICMTIAYGLAATLPAMILALAWARPGDLPAVCWPEKQVPKAPAEERRAA